MNDMQAVLGSLLFWTLACAMTGVALWVMIVGIAFLIEVIMNLDTGPGSGASTGGFMTMYYGGIAIFVIPIAAGIGLIWGIFPPARESLQQNGIGGSLVPLLIASGIMVATGLITGFAGWSKLSAADAKRQARERAEAEAQAAADASGQADTGAIPPSSPAGEESALS